MSVLGRWWGSPWRGSAGERANGDGATDPGHGATGPSGADAGAAATQPETGPETAQLRIGRRRRRRFAWGSAREVEVGPTAAAHPSPAVGAGATGGTTGTPDGSRATARATAEPGVHAAAAPPADAPAPAGTAVTSRHRDVPAHGRHAATDVDPPTPPYGTPFDHDAGGGRATDSPERVGAPPWRRPATPPWGAPNGTAPPAGSVDTDAPIGGTGGDLPTDDHSPASTAATAGSDPDMSTPFDPPSDTGPAGTPGTTGDAPDAPDDRGTPGTPDDGLVNGHGAAGPVGSVGGLGTDLDGTGPDPAPVTPAPPDPTATAPRAATGADGSVGDVSDTSLRAPGTADTAAPGPERPVTDAPDDALAQPAAATVSTLPETTSAPGSEQVPAVPAGATIDRHRLAQARLGIDEVTPEVEGGRFAAKAVVGEVVPVGATVWREGHDAVAATLVWQHRRGLTHADVPRLPEPDDSGAHRARMVPSGTGTDRVAGSFVPDTEGLWSFHVEAHSDAWATWRHAVEVKAAAGQGAAELANDLETGARLLERGAAGIEDRVGTPAPPEADGTADVTAPIPMPPRVALATACREAAAALRDAGLPLPERIARALSEPVHRTMTEHPVRDLVTRGATHHVFVERELALAGSWYEFFPRSTGGRDAEGRPVHGTFATATRELDRVAAMGFDVAYLPPIHPVGTVNRKGRNNTLDPGPTDVGSPWAIGSAAGGHDAVDPLLGTIDDFDDFVARARELGLDVALDLALQCAPDHPWAAAHPEWFVVRPDGTIAYAENPPKRYQDIYPVNFDTDPDGIYAEVLRVVLYWMEHGVRVFRVDNPHTKPPDFWSWLIAEVHRRDPGVVFLAEAFTRPARLFGLAKAGFSQSYTYFTWRTGKQELQEFFELHRDRIDECRPNCFVNTPDILHESLQVGGPGTFALRAALAATLSPTWGVYSGFELFEHQPVRAGSEEYLDSEKYELRPRDFAGALAEGRSLEPWIARLNAIRRAHPALRQLRTLRFHEIDNDALIAFSKTDPRSGDTVLCVVTLNPFGAEEGMLRLDPTVLGLSPYERFEARDEVSGQVFDWGRENYVRLEPWRDVAHVVSVRRR